MASGNPYQSPKQYSKPRQEAVPTTIMQILFSFAGRVPRRVYWGATIGIVVIFYAAAFGLMAAFGPESEMTMIALLILYVPMIWISLAIQVKRWHDRDKSGWWVLINMLPIIGPLWAFIELGCLRGTEGTNTYGLDPT